MDHASRYIDYYHKYEFSDRYCIIYYPFKNYLVLRGSSPIRRDCSPSEVQRTYSPAVP